MSTSTFDEDFDFGRIEREFRSMLDEAPEMTYPILMVSPDMLKNSPDLKKYLTLPWCAIKVHGYFHPWQPFGKPIRRILAIARDLGLPVMLHTGGRDRSDAGSHSRLCAEFHDVPMILAHGRPIAQAIRVMKDCGNVFADTAFMPLDDVKAAIAAGLSDRIVFGSDLPANKEFYPRVSYAKWYKPQVEGLFGLNAPEFSKWTRGNFVMLFKKRPSVLP